MASDETQGKDQKVFVFDFHGTIADTDIPKAIATGIVYLPIIIPTIFYRLFWKYSILKHIWQHGSCKQYPLGVIIKDACAPAAACQTLRSEVVNAIEKLQGKGYPLYIFSGITPGSYAILCNKHPDFFSLFKKVIGVGFNGCLSKDDQGFYVLCNDMIFKDMRDKTPRIVFFDNEKDNCDRGKAQGWKTVHVTSPEQCAAEIRLLVDRQ